MKKQILSNLSQKKFSALRAARIIIILWLWLWLVAVAVAVAVAAAVTVAAQQFVPKKIFCAATNMQNKMQNKSQKQTRIDLKLS